MLLSRWGRRTEVFARSGVQHKTLRTSLFVGNCHLCACCTTPNALSLTRDFYGGTEMTRLWNALSSPNGIRC